MPYRETPFAQDCFYHIYSRGNNKAPIFFEESNYQRFLTKLKEYKEKYGISLLCYSLVSNHFHLELRQNSKYPVSKFVGDLLNSHAKYLTFKYDLIGHIFQGPFKAKLIKDDAYLLQLSRYIHLHPIKERIIKLAPIPKRKGRRLNEKLRRRLRSYPWSSYPEYLNPQKTDLTEKDWVMGSFSNPRGYRNFVEEKISHDDIPNLRELEIFT